MGLTVDIEKRLGDFHLRAAFEAGGEGGEGRGRSRGGGGWGCGAVAQA